ASSIYIEYNLQGSYTEKATGNCTYDNTSTIISYAIQNSFSNTTSISASRSWSYSPFSGVDFEATTTFTPSLNSTYTLSVNSQGSVSVNTSVLDQGLIEECSSRFGGKIVPNSSTYYAAISLGGSGSWNQSETVTSVNDECINATLNGIQPINHDVKLGLSWSPYENYHTSNAGGIPMVGICEACRDVFNVTFPTINVSNVGSGFQESYNCPNGYSGSIYSCSKPPSVSSILNGTQGTVSSFSTNYYSPTTSCIRASSTSCNVCNSVSGYTGALPPTCIGYGIAQNGTFLYNYAVQYSQKNDFGVGLGVSAIVAPSSYSIPSQKPIKEDAYMTNLQVGEQDQENAITQYLPPTSVAEKYEVDALSISNTFPFVMFSLINNQYPPLGISGLPPLLSNEYDFAVSLYGSGTSENCNLTSPSYHDIFELGEGSVCSGTTLPSSYSKGIFVPLGQLNSGTHTISFDSISENGSTSNPTITLYNQYGPAFNVSCPGAINTTDSSKGSIVFSKDINCDNIESLFRGYIISCIVYSNNLPGAIYSFNQSYYMAYNFPTVWEISYTLLVAPKSLTNVPVPISVKNNQLAINTSLIS
ncbi:MAG: hypothetical protein QXP36_12280, partial [Conexivisphaerales archaeon]